MIRSELSEFDWIFDEVGSGIKVLIERFTQTPYFFYSEQDMHAYLYHKLVLGRLGEFYVETSTGDRTILLHREYPTLKKYGRARGHFDLAIIDPADMSASHWRTQIRKPRYAGHRLKDAVERGLNDFQPHPVQLRNALGQIQYSNDPEKALWNATY